MQSFILRKNAGRGQNQSSFDLYFPRPVSDETKMRADASKDCLETHQNVTWLTIITILLKEGSPLAQNKYFLLYLMILLFTVLMIFNPVLHHFCHAVKINKAVLKSIWCRGKNMLGL